MKVCTCFLLFTIFAYTHSTVQQSPQNQRSVNLALETVLEFRDKDKAADLKFLDNVQNFITKVKTVIDKNGKTHDLRRDFKTMRGVTFTGFIQDVVQILNTFEETDLKEFFKVLDDEIRKYHYRGCKFYELTDNYETRKFLAAKLDVIKGKPVPVIKAYINILADALRDESYNDNVRELVDYINSFYRKDSEQTFQKVFSDLEGYSKSTKSNKANDLVTIVRDGIRSTIFDHYSSLHPNARRELKNKVETFLKPPKVTTTTTTKRTDIFYSKFVNYVKPSENMVTEEEKPKLVTKKEPKYTTSKRAEVKKETSKKHENTKAARIIIKESDYKKPIIMRDGSVDEKKGYKYTRANPVQIPLQDKEITLSTTQDDHEQRAKYEKSQETSKQFSSEQVVSGKSFESNSIEFSQELQREYNTKRYMTLYPEEITYRPTTTKKKKGKIVHRSEKITTTKSKVQTLWIEESTGRLPKALLNKMTTKPKSQPKRKPRTSHETKTKSKHVSKHVKKQTFKNKTEHGKKQAMRHGKIYTKKYKSKHEKPKTTHSKKKDVKYVKKHDTKHEKKITSKHETKHSYKHEPKGKKYVKHSEQSQSEDREYIFRQNDVKSTNMELYKYKKMMGPVRVELKPDIKKPVPSKTTKARVYTKSYKTTKPSLPRRHQVQTKQTIPPRPPIPPRSRADKRPMKPTQKTTRTAKKSTAGPLATAAFAPKGKRYELMSGKQFIHFRKSAELPLWSDEGLSIEQFVKDQKAKEKSLRKSASLEKDPSVIKRINELEKELKDVKSKISNITVGGTTVKKTTDVYDAKVVTEKDKKSELNSRTYVNTLANDLIIKKDSVKLTGKEEKAPQYKTEFKYVKGKESVFREDAYDNDNKTKQQETTKDNKTSSHAKVIENSKGNMKAEKLFSEDRNYDSERENNFVHNYDEVDEWKEAFKYDRIKATKTTTRATKPPTNTPKAVITERPTATITKTASLPPVTSPKLQKDMKNDAVNATFDNNPKTTAQVASDISKTIFNVTNTYATVNKLGVTNNVTSTVGANTTVFEPIVTSSSNDINNKDDGYSTPSVFYRRVNDDIIFTDP